MNGPLNQNEEPQGFQRQLNQPIPDPPRRGDFENEEEYNEALRVYRMATGTGGRRRNRRRRILKGGTSVNPNVLSFEDWQEQTEMGQMVSGLSGRNSAKAHAAYEVYVKKEKKRILEVQYKVFVQGNH